MLAAGSMTGSTGFSASQPRRVRWHRAVTRLRLWSSTAQGHRGRSSWVGCFWSPVVKQKEKGKGKEEEKEKEKGNGMYLEVEPSRSGGEDMWSAQSEVAETGRFPEHLIIMVNGLVGR